MELQWTRTDQSQRAQLVKHFIILIIIHWTKQKKNNSYLCFFTDGKQNKASELDRRLPLIKHCGHTRNDYLWPWLLYKLQFWRYRCWFRKFTVRFRPIIPPEGVLKKVLYREAPPQGPTPHPFISTSFPGTFPASKPGKSPWERGCFYVPFFQKRYPFRIPS